MTHQLNLKVYIAGPMTGLPDNNYPAFHKADFDLRNQGHIPLNPALNKASTWLGFMRCSLRQIADADCLYMLAGWRTSKGAKVEHQLALDLHLPIFYEGGSQPSANKPASPDLIAAATKEVSPGVKEGWTAAQAKLAEKVVMNAYEVQSPDHPSTGTGIPKQPERFVVQGLDIADQWATLTKPSSYASAEKALEQFGYLLQGKLPLRILPVKKTV